MGYPYETLTINSRDVPIADIIAGNASGRSIFETETFTFVRQWLTGLEEFHLQTSGSTGHPKKITIRRFQMQESARATQRALDLRKGDTALVCLDTRFIAGKMMLVRSLVCEMRIQAVEPSANPLDKLASSSSVDFAALVPYQLETILGSEALKRLEQVRVVIVGGAAVSEETIRQLQGLRSRIFATYGMTETVSHIALKALNGPEKDNAFKALPGVKIGRDLRGCLQINASYLEHPLVTNDLVEIINPTSFRWMGRIDNVINSGGVKVSPEDLEARLDSVKLSLNLHDRIVITSAPDALFGERIVMVLERRNLEKDLEVLIFGRIAEVLTRFEMPRSILALSPFPETPTGKIDRTKLKNMVSKRL